jgi:hypothetical protein
MKRPRAPFPAGYLFAVQGMGAQRVPSKAESTSLESALLCAPPEGRVFIVASGMSERRDCKK